MACDGETPTAPAVAQELRVEKAIRPGDAPETGCGTPAWHGASGATAAELAHRFEVFAAEHLFHAFAYRSHCYVVDPVSGVSFRVEPQRARAALAFASGARGAALAAQLERASRTPLPSSPNCVVSGRAVSSAAPR